jgi:hypothetical protein
MIGVSVHILIISGFILLSAFGLSFVKNVSSKQTRSKAISETISEKNEEYLLSKDYINVVAKLSSVRDVKLNDTLRHKIHGS